ncbi:MAG: iron export ABC transporter permease subunit FetB [Deltaproteobacteria bacterium]|nr:iron export ABC transporter permease subunit FetB [Deltaproteobacteria bacterium]
MSAIPPIGAGQLALALVFVLLAGAANLWLKLGLGRDLLVGTVRTFAQLFLMGYVLVYVFRVEQAWLVLAMFAGMIFFAARIVAGRVKNKGPRVFNPVFLSMLGSYMVVTFLVVAVVVQAQPWWEARYFLPLGGMVVGNSMNAMALSLERLFSEVKNRRLELEMLLSLGADPREASAGAVADSVAAGMIPTINSMMGVGVVFLPGMMTGQILAGADPLVSIKYQIVVMLMLVGSTTLASLLAVHLARRRLFNPAGQLAWPPLGVPKSPGA